MKFKIILLLAALLLFLSHPALSGLGCGSNWLGSDTNDQDFYVSKNQNLGAGTPSTSPSNSLSATGQPAKIGQLSKADTGSLIKSLLPDRPSPKGAGTAITWTAAADRKDLLYKFYLKGPATNNQLTPKTDWTTSNIWIWNTTASDVGNSYIEVRARDGKTIEGSEGFDDRKNASFTIEVSNSENIKNKPRIAPDERPVLPSSSGNPNGPNMSMPDPSPKPLKSMATEAVAGANPGGASANSQSDSNAVPEDLGGKWLVSLDKSGESMDLILIQTGVSIMGSGNLNGETKIPLTASGSIDKDEIKLNVKTVVGKYVNQIDKHYEMDLKFAKGALSGTYQAYSGETSAGKGRVAATRQGA